jgi:PAS domain S-box-containing protein
MSSKHCLNNATGIILESISEGVFTIDHAWCITSFNRAAEKITGIDRQEAIGRYCWEVLRSNMCEQNCPLQKTMRTGEHVVNNKGYIIDRNGHRIPVSVSTALLKDETGTVLGGVETFRDLSEVEELRKELQNSFRVGDMLSNSKSMFKIFKILPRLAESESTVLIQGETGTGKELLAKAVHHLSNRKDKPFVTINCGALPDNLLESELFGYKPGAFTDAKKEKPGQFLLAEGGTIFLDEIAETSQAFQVKLLRILQEKSFTPLGGTQAIKVNVRIVTATNKDLALMVEEGSFRQDLYYRINVLKVHIPPLRERKEDIPLLVDHFIQRFNKLQKRSISGISQQALALLMVYDFPGNIRELENIIEYALVICPLEVIQVEHLPEYLQPENSPELEQKGFKDKLNQTEARAIQDALARNNYNRSQAALELGMHKSTLYRKLKKLGLNLPSKPSSADQA